MGDRSGLLLIGRLIFLLQLVTGILGWGKEGHYAICKIAEGYLTEDAVAAIKELLPESADGDLAAVCSWADEVRFHYHWSSALHYIDTPDFICNYKYCRDCHDSAAQKDRCVTGAIFNYTNQLTSAYQNLNSEFNYNLTEALMFLAHFIGDVHQPLHVGFTGDLGGNTIQVRWYHRKTNLHHVWDDMIIDLALKTFYSSDIAIMIQAIQNNMTVGPISYLYGNIVKTTKRFVQTYMLLKALVWHASMHTRMLHLEALWKIAIFCLGCPLWKKGLPKVAVA